MKTFKDWVTEKEQVHKETSTSTADVAHFARPVIGGPAVEREFPELIATDEKKKKKLR